ncbi:MAG: LamG domain-containing protein [Verrucomicrobiota bacterium]
MTEPTEELVDRMLEEARDAGPGSDAANALNELLRSAPEAREIASQLLMDESRMVEELRKENAARSFEGDSIFPKLAPVAKAQTPRVHPAWWMGLAAAAVIALLINAVMLMQQPDSGMEVVDSEMTNSVDGIAVLSRAVAVEWTEGATRHRAGDSLPAGRLSITSGLAQVEFFGGATVIIEGPAEMELKSPQLAVFHRGRMRAFVPEPAQGFTIEGPDFDTVDLGTEFAMSVDETGRSEVHVVDGEVALHQKDGPLLSNLTTGEGARLLDGQSALESIAASDAGFIGREEMLKLADESWRVRAAEWAIHRDKIVADPDTVAYFDFENHEAWDRQLLSAKPGKPRGGIVGAQWTQGRWPGKGALEFKRISDRVRLQIPGEFDSMTLATWVRIEGLDRWLSSLMLTDSWESGEPHWQINDEGGLVFGILDVGTIRTESTIGPEHLGRWLHLAAVYDRETRRLTLYLDGETVSSMIASGDVSLRIDGAEIGNWRPGKASNKRNAIRSLNGRIDEFMILSRALSAAEIAELHRVGNPSH